MTRDQAIQLLGDEELLARELPEVLALAGCPQKGPYHTEGDVLIHTKLVVSNITREASPALVWAALLHDIAKPLTISERERGGELINQFFKHEVIGADLAAAITERRGVSAAERDKIWWLVRNHMRIAALPEMRERKTREFVAHVLFPDLLELFRADVHSSISRTEALRTEKEELVKRVENIFRMLS